MTSLSSPAQARVNALPPPSTPYPRHSPLSAPCPGHVRELPTLSKTWSATSSPCQRPSRPVRPLSYQCRPCRRHVNQLSTHGVPKHRPAVSLSGSLMNVYEYLARATPQKGSKLAPYSDEIRVLLEHGRKYQAIVNFLFEAHNLTVKRQSLREFCLRHFAEESADLTNGVRRPSTPPLHQPKIVANGSSDQAAPHSSHAIGETEAFIQSLPEAISPPDPSHEQTGVPAHAGSQSVESAVILRNDASKAPAFQPAPHGHVPNIERSNPRARDASRLLAFFSAPEKPRRSEKESQELDERSEALKAADRKQRREQPR